MVREVSFASSTPSPGLKPPAPQSNSDDWSWRARATHILHLPLYARMRV